MKFSSALLLFLSCLASSASAFTSKAQPSLAATAAVDSSTALSASRRHFMEAAAAVAMILGPSAAMAEPRPSYLTDPTEDFKISEAKSAVFKRAQLMRKKEFTEALEKLSAEANDSDALVKDVKDIQALVAKTGGMPEGVKKDAMVKIIRTKKAKGFWPTPVEIAYQSLIQEIAFQQSPNVEKDLGNFYQ